MQGGSGTRPSPAAADGRVGGPRLRHRRVARRRRRSRERRRHRRRRAHAGEQVDVEEVFAKFKEGVAKQIGVDDAQSHYDLGVAYKEMGLLDDAIREFETAGARPEARVRLPVDDRDDPHRARQPQRGDRRVHARPPGPERTKEQEAALSYEIGAAYEVKRMNKQALDYFQRAARLVPTFRDVQERIRRLQKAEPKQPPRAVAVGADDEFDRAFDDILGNGKS